MLFSCSIDTQSFFRDKSSSVSQVISGKYRNFQKLQRYFSGIVTSTFKAGTGGSAGCGGWDASTFGGGCGGLSGVFPTICL